MHTLIKKSDQVGAVIFDGRFIANKPVTGGRLADGAPSSSLFYWSHAEVTGDCEFPLHPHEGFEIMTFVLAGQNSHYDTETKVWTPLGAGDVQVIRSGSGLSHRERVAAGSSAFQIWFDPDYRRALGKAPTYDDYPVASFSARHQDGLRVTDLVGGESPVESDTEGLRISSVATEGPERPVGLPRHSLTVAYALDGTSTVDGHRLHPHDALVVRGEDRLSVATSAGASLFLLSVPEEPSYQPVRER